MLTRKTGARDGEIQAAASVDVGYCVEEEEEGRKSQKGHRILNAIKSTVGSGLNVSLTTDKAKAAIGAHHAIDRRGVVKFLKLDPYSSTRRTKDKRGTHT